jgi:carbon-monoxide dehydrogenase small subunit
MLMTSADLLAEDPDPDREAIRHALEGNLCRCTGYQGVVDAVEAAAEAYPTTARESETSADAPGSVSEAEWNE